jgi:alkylhydroperoxidase family enzyme
MQFHDVDVKTQFKRMRELVPETYRAFLEFDQKAFKDGAIPGKTKELIALGIAQITQCPWCIGGDRRRLRRGDRGDDVRRDGNGRRRRVEPRRPRAPVPAGAQGLSGRQKG